MLAEKSRFHVYARCKTLSLDWQSYDVTQSAEASFAVLYWCEELATQLISHHGSIFLGVILLGMNKSRPWKCPWTTSKKRKKRTKNENTAMNKQAKATAMGSSLQKIDRFGSRERRCNDCTCSLWLACLFLSDPMCFSATYQLKSFRRIRHK